MSQKRPRYPELLAAFLSAAAFAEGVPELVILGGDRRAKTIRARQRFMAEAYAAGKWSTPQIGAFIDRDHTTVLHGIRRHKARAAA